MALMRMCSTLKKRGLDFRVEFAGELSVPYYEQACRDYITEHQLDDRLASGNATADASPKKYHWQHCHDRIAQVELHTFRSKLRLEFTNRICAAATDKSTIGAATICAPRNPPASMMSVAAMMNARPFIRPELTRKSPSCSGQPTHGPRGYQLRAFGLGGLSRGVDLRLQLRELELKALGVCHGRAQPRQGQGRGQFTL